VKKSIGIILCFAIFLSSVPMRVSASHSHNDACYGSGCTKHTHVSSCESVSKTSTSGSTARTCTTCGGTNSAASSSKAVTCGGAWQAVPHATSSSSTGAGGYYDITCDTCGYIHSSGGSWYGGQSGSSSNPPELPSGTCTQKIFRCGGTLIDQGQKTYGSYSDGYTTYWKTKCSECEAIYSYRESYPNTGMWNYPEYNPGKACPGIYTTCNACTSGKQYITNTCGKTADVYYDGDSLASVSCDKVVKLLILKK